jgi:hypothetical protein
MCGENGYLLEQKVMLDVGTPIPNVNAIIDPLSSTSPTRAEG